MPRRGHRGSAWSGRDFHHHLFSPAPQYPDDSPEHSHSRTPPPWAQDLSSSGSAPSLGPAPVSSAGTVSPVIIGGDPPPQSAWPPWPTVPPHTAFPGLPRAPSAPPSPPLSPLGAPAASVASSFSRTPAPVSHYEYQQTVRENAILLRQNQELRRLLAQRGLGSSLPAGSSTSAPPVPPEDEPDD